MLSITDHLDEHLFCFLRGSDLAWEFDADTFHSLFRLKTKAEAETVDWLESLQVARATGPG